jgi:cation transport ATPase
VHEFNKQEPLLGSTVQSDISVTNGEAHAGKLFVGMLFQVREGRRIVADGMITSIKTKALER